MRMKQLFATSYQLIERTSTEFVRYLYNEIRWGNRLIAISKSITLHTVMKLCTLH